MPDWISAALCPVHNKSDRKCYQAPDLPAKNSTEKQQLIKAGLFEAKTINYKKI